MGQGKIDRQIADIAAECGGTMSMAVRSIKGAFDLSANDGLIVSSASIIKVPILVEAMSQVSAGALSLDKEYVLADEDRVRGSGVMRYLHTGAVLTLKDLLTLMIIVSDNTATNIVIDTVGIDNVNRRLKDMGYCQTALQRKMYDWAAIEKGLDNVCTAGEMADLMARIAVKEAVGGQWDEMILDMLHHQQDTSRLGMLLPETAKLANKTGSREGVFHDCGIVSTGDFAYAISVFTVEARSAGEAQLAIARVSRVVFDAVATTRRPH